VLQHHAGGDGIVLVGSQAEPEQELAEVGRRRRVRDGPREPGSAALAEPLSRVCDGVGNGLRLEPLPQTSPSSG
jgi:hypothetical protein